MSGSRGKGKIVQGWLPYLTSTLTKFRGRTFAWTWLEHHAPIASGQGFEHSLMPRDVSRAPLVSRMWKTWGRCRPRRYLRSHAQFQVLQTRPPCAVRSTVVTICCLPCGVSLQMAVKGGIRLRSEIKRRLCRWPKFTQIPAFCRPRCGQVKILRK